MNMELGSILLREHVLAGFVFSCGTIAPLRLLPAWSHNGLTFGNLSAGVHQTADILGQFVGCAYSISWKIIKEPFHKSPAAVF